MTHTHTVRSTSTGIMALAMMVLVSGCQDEPITPLDVAEGCNPLLAGFDCMAPYPSNFFLNESEDGTRRIELQEPAYLEMSRARLMDTPVHRNMDGFSRTSPIVFRLGEVIGEKNWVGIIDDAGKSVDYSSPTLLIHAESGALVPHFVDLDTRAEEPIQRGLVIRPLTALEPDARYVVAVHGILGEDGTPIAAPEGFRRLQEKRVADTGVLATLKGRYERDIFPVLKETGIARSAWQLAWDFTTAKQETVVRDMLTMRTLVLAELERNPAELIITSVTDHADGAIARTITGMVRGPSVLAEEEAVEGLTRDVNGDVALNGTVEVPFYSEIPRSLLEGDKPGSVLQFGHGFFGSRKEGVGGSVRSIIDEIGAVSFSIDWWGMCELDVANIITGFSGDVPLAIKTTDRLVQSMANWLNVSNAIAGAMMEHEAFQRTQPDASGSTLAYDPEQLNFMGISMGAIYGGTYATLNPALKKVVLHVGGGSISHIMFRAQPFAVFLYIIDQAFPNRLEQQKLSAMLQSHLDRFESIGFADYLVNHDLPMGPASNRTDRQVLVQIGYADTQVPNFSSWMHARSAGLPLVGPSPQVPYGFESVSYPHTGSGLTIFDMGLDNAFYETPEPPEFKTPIHDGLRNEREVLYQLDKFFNEGVIVDPCDGGCGADSRLVH